LKNDNIFIYDVNGIKVFYTPELDGGGTSFGQMFVPILKRLNIKVDACYEPFCGPSFIGFSLLANGICNRLVLSDINKKAIKLVKITIKENGLEGKVRYYVSNVLNGIPTGEKFDLVVANPPHFSENSIKGFNGLHTKIELLKALDKNWDLHKRFYASITRYLNDSGKILFIENSQGSSPDVFIPIIKNSGLKYVNTIYPTISDINYAVNLNLQNYKHVLRKKKSIKKIFSFLPDQLFKAVLNAYLCAFGYKSNSTCDLSKLYFILSQK